ncbi:MAG: type II toxin-antitoxin system VapC family toxin [Mesorhizobium sp.]|nr:type II toxin-antitoxin system VapC family toxin [Mesorhizobium sp.]MCO5163056.1 type II toxin-antitoxin system VapC family toxin [Mesorhizobium sp.]
MFIETSAIVAILLEEPDAPHLLERIEIDPAPTTSVVNAVEATISVGKQIRNYERAWVLVRSFMEEARLQVEGIPADALDGIVDTYLRYGKGTGHPARLNFGDCFSYALAKRADLELLYKGGDFSQTDLA